MLENKCKEIKNLETKGKKKEWKIYNREKKSEKKIRNKNKADTQKNIYTKKINE